MRVMMIVILLAVFAWPANAQLQLSDFFVELSEAAPTDAIYVSNNGTETLYLRVGAVGVSDPAAVEPEFREEVDPRKLGLLVSPQRLVLAPGEEGRLRLVALAKPEHDTFYKISVVPVTGDLSTDAQVGVKVMVGYSAWAWIRPEGTRPRVAARRVGTKLLLRNSGDTLAQMMLGQQCSHGVCEKIAPVRILAGKERTVDLPFSDSPVTFRITWGNESEDVRY